MSETYHHTAALQFTIAGLSFGIQGDKTVLSTLRRLDGFAPFLVKGEPPVDGYTFRSDCRVERICYNPEDHIQHTLLHQFDFENIKCYFYSIAREGYQFEMIEPHCIPFIIRYCHDSRLIEATATDSPTQLRFGLWMAYGLVAAAQKRIAIHSSVIAYPLENIPAGADNSCKAVLFLGESGTGKSTHTRLWREFVPGCFLLNDDSPIIQTELLTGKTVIHGSPWSGKTPCYKNQSCEVAAIVRLSQAPHNKLRKISRLQSIGALIPSCPPAFAYDPYLQNCILGTLSDILQRTPVYHLECLPDEEAVQTVLKEIVSL